MPENIRVDNPVIVPHPVNDKVFNRRFYRVLIIGYQEQAERIGCIEILKSVSSSVKRSDKTCFSVYLIRLIRKTRSVCSLGKRRIAKRLMLEIKISRKRKVPVYAATFFRVERNRIS